jgi:hypothetical protein
MAILPPLSDDWYSLLILTMIATDSKSVKISGDDYLKMVAYLAANPQFVIVVRSRGELELRLINAEELKQHLEDAPVTGVIG